MLPPCGHLGVWADLLALVCDVYYDFVTFPFGILGQVWYLIGSIQDPCCHSYFVGGVFHFYSYFNRLFFKRIVEILDLQGLSMFYKKDARLIWVKTVSVDKSNGSP